MIFGSMIQDGMVQIGKTTICINYQILVSTLVICILETEKLRYYNNKKKR